MKLFDLIIFQYHTSLFGLFSDGSRCSVSSFQDNRQSSFEPVFGRDSRVYGFIYKGHMLLWNVIFHFVVAAGMMSMSMVMIVVLMILVVLYLGSCISLLEILCLF